MTPVRGGKKRRALSATLFLELPQTSRRKSGHDSFRSTPCLGFFFAQDHHFNSPETSQLYSLTLLSHNTLSFMTTSSMRCLRRVSIRSRHLAVVGPGFLQVRSVVIRRRCCRTVAQCKPFICRGHHLPVNTRSQKRRSCPHPWLQKNKSRNYSCKIQGTCNKLWRAHSRLYCSRFCKQLLMLHHFFEII